MNIETVKTQLRRLRLSAAARELEPVLLQHQKAVSLDWFSDLLTRELDARMHILADRERGFSLNAITHSC